MSIPNQEDNTPPQANFERLLQFVQSHNQLPPNNNILTAVQIRNFLHNLQNQEQEPDE
jgi:hypothetical protein